MCEDANRALSAASSSCDLDKGCRATKKLPVQHMPLTSEHSGLRNVLYFLKGPSHPDCQNRKYEAISHIRADCTYRCIWKSFIEIHPRNTGEWESIGNKLLLISNPGNQTKIPQWGLGFLFVLFCFTEEEKTRSQDEEMLYAKCQHGAHFYSQLLNPWIKKRAQRKYWQKFKHSGPKLALCRCRQFRWC